MKRCEACNDTGNVPAPPTNAWRLYFQKRGGHYAAYHVLVECRACGGLSGRANRKAMAERLETRKRAEAIAPI